MGFGRIQGLLGLGENSVNAYLFDRAERRREALAREAMGVAAEGSEWTQNPAPYLQGLYTPDLDKYLQTNRNLTGEYQTNYDRFGPDYAAFEGKGVGAIRGGMDSAAGMLSRANVDPGEMAAQVGGYFPQDANFQESLASELGAIGAKGRSRAQMDRAQMMSQALAQGKSLQDVQSDLDRYQFDADSQRALEAQSARGESEKLRIGAALERGRNMTSAATTAADIRAGLARTGAEAAVASGKNIADYLGELSGQQGEAASRYAAGMGQAAIADQEKGQAYLDEYKRFNFDPQQMANYASLGAIERNAALRAGILAGLPVGTFQTNFDNFANYMTQTEAARLSKPEKQSGFSTIFGGASW